MYLLFHGLRLVSHVITQAATVTLTTFFITYGEIIKIMKDNVKVIRFMAYFQEIGSSTNIFGYNTGFLS